MANFVDAQTHHHTRRAFASAEVAANPSPEDIESNLAINGQKFIG
jgi:hypothetical protein